MVSITEYSCVLGKTQLVEGINAIKAVPVDNDRKLSEMIIECYNHFNGSPDVIYIAHSIPFTRGNDRNDSRITVNSGTPVIWLSGLPCSITHMAIKLAVAQIKSGQHNRILVLGADKAYSDRERRFFGTIMGDAVVGMMLEQRDGLHDIISSHLDTVIIASEGENSNPELIQKYRDTLPLWLRDAYKRCLSATGLEKVDYIAPHTPNRGVWDVFSKLTGIDRHRILDEDIVRTGHFNSNDSFYHYFTHCENNIIQPEQTAMLINPGFGGTRGCTILRRKNNVHN